MDLSGGALKKKGKGNIFAEIIERRRHEGDVAGFWRTKSLAEPTSGSWASRCLRAMVLLVALGAVFVMVILPRLFPNRSPAAPYLPRDSGVTAPAVKAPVNPKMQEALERLKKEGAPTGTAGPARPAAAGEAPSPGESGEPPIAPPPPPPPPPAPKPRPQPPPAGDASGVPAGAATGGARPFRPPEPEFKQLAALDREVLDKAWDDIQYPEMGSDIKAEGEVVAHIYRFLRTHGADLARLADPRLTHGEMMREPDANRGKVVSTRVQLIKKYNVQGWPRNDSGVLDTSMLFCFETAPHRGRGIYVVLVAEPLENYREEDLYYLTGVFMKRYAYINSSNVWQWQPLILAMKLTPAELPAATSQHVTMAIVILAAVGVIVLLFMVRGETREGQEKRAIRIERRRAAREQLKQQLGAGAVRPPEPSAPPGPPPAGPGADPPADPQGPGEKPPGGS
jgi:hypothetical protein